MLTCYDAYTAALLARAGIDAALVGDSASMVVHGMGSTLGATMDMMELHVRAVRAGSPELCVIADMPFLSTRGGLASAVEAARRFMAAGANAVKIEGLSGHEELIPALSGGGVPVMGHLGLTPQSVNALGGYGMRGKAPEEAERIASEALELERLGCFSIVLECVPRPLAARITESLSIPTIGIGAGPSCDGQVLVLQDMLGLTLGHRPSFVKQYLDGAALIAEALGRYSAEVRDGTFPEALAKRDKVDAARDGASLYGGKE
jgi:3-methyl-2-oxobutanoate hydroxymethyltransferase